MNAMVTMMEEAAQVIEFKPVISGGSRGIVRSEPHHVCRACERRPSRFVVRGIVKADRAHTLCFECYRAVVNKTRALRRRVTLDIRMLASGLPVPARQRGDRAQFYADLTRRRHHALIAARHAAEGVTGMPVPDSLRSAGAALQKVS